MNSSRHVPECRQILDDMNLSCEVFYQVKSFKSKRIVKKSTYKKEMVRSDVLNNYFVNFLLEIIQKFKRFKEGKRIFPTPKIKLYSKKLTKLKGEKMNSLEAISQ